MTTRISHEEMMGRARVFVERWADETRERAESQTFWNEFFNIFGIDRYEYARFAARAARFAGPGEMDVHWPHVIAIEHKSRGKDLNKALGQLREYLADPEVDPVPIGVVCDFEKFFVEDFNTGDLTQFGLADLPNHLTTTFGSLLDGRQTRLRVEEEITGKAAASMANLHEALAENYPEHDLMVLLVRLLFIMFADDSGVWESALFTTEIENRSADDLGMYLADLFQELDTPLAERDHDSNYIYVNGGLFEETLRIKHFSEEARRILLECCHDDWSAISPVIFGSIFQSVMDDSVRRELGAHYTPEANILKVIKPLFLDELWAAFDQAYSSEQALRNLQRRMSEMTFLDPACGCGNFLMVTYRELRRLELQILIRGDELTRERTQKRESERLRQNRPRRGSRSSWLKPGQSVTSVADLSMLSPAQFFGIELSEFPARIAETGMYLVDHLANMELSAVFGVHLTRFPITEESTIEIGNALRIDWNAVLAADQCGYVFGNPPFGGRGTRKPEQSDDLKEVWGTGYDVNLDYVTGWYEKTRDYLEGTPIRAAFVSTNSICQGAQIVPLWEPLLASGIRIDFAHQTFDWTSELPNAAAVHVVIVGFSDTAVLSGRTRRLFRYPDGGASREVESNPTRINPYLVAGPNILVNSESQPLSPVLPTISFGNMARDGGAFFLDETEVQVFLEDPAARDLVRQVVGGREMLHGEDRWCLWMDGVDPGRLRASRLVVDRLHRVREFRLASRAAETREMAETPWLFAQRAQPKTNYLAIPRTVSENRQWFTVGHYPAETVATDSLFTAEDPDRFVFGVLSSRMFLVWLKNVGGKLKSDFRFSKTLVYNSFPMPAPNDKQRAVITEAADAVVDARQAHPDSSLADLYDPLVMPTDLRQTHVGLDKAIDTVFRPRKKTFDDDQDRLSLLLERYEEMMDSASGALVFSD